MAGNRLSHIVLRDRPENTDFISARSSGGGRSIPSRQRDSHSAYLKSRLEQAWRSVEDERAVAHIERDGVYIEFKSDPGADLVTKSLEDMKSKKVRLLNIRTEKETITDDTTNQPKEVVTTYATVFIANEKKEHFLKKIEEYAEQDTPKGHWKNADLINSIADIRKALAIDSFWQDDKSLIPGDTPNWCEIWLSNDTEEVISRFNNLLNRLEIPSKNGIIRFPERAVKVVLTNRAQLEQLSALSDDIAEYRLGKSTAEFWTGLRNKDQAEWVQNLLKRTRYEQSPGVSVCLLDTGVNHGHPLISPVLSDGDCQAVDSAWGSHDHDKHGTLMAGVAAYGDLVKALSGSGPIYLRHCLESVKILPPVGSNPTELWGYVTSQGVSLSEIEAPDRKRVHCMAVAADDTRDRGRPSSWSGQLDQIIAGTDDDIRRLMIVSAGNTDPSGWAQYPAAQLTDSIHDPGQSWNALTVGAYTKMDTILDPSLQGYSPVAPQCGLSPFSTTSFCWEDNKWPIKPEIVLEGGNAARDASGFTTECDDLSLLSTYYNPLTSHFHPFNMTSAATAQAAWMAAQIQIQYPDLWPETIRALVVHSANWPDGLWNQFSGDGSKTAIKKLLSTCGYGVPNLERALFSASNFLTLIAQAELNPFDKKRDDTGNTKSGYRTKDMHLYELPWPKEVLRSMPDDIEVEMRVTLSYFIEPGPGEIGWQDRYRYASHALRFDLKSPTETKEQFVKRINKAAREEEEGHPGTQSASDHWKIGQARNRGSIHSDIWQGTASELAESNIIAIAPRIGWWRERAHLGRWSRRARYSLVVSIMTPEERIDVYTPVANQVGISVPIEVTT
ncbi:MAG: peptidase S8 [Deltaproteobacteria bacterium HGW-Deltaproteobacteria-19]|nr:MAG: peptidase S8 [Deltaproteobacteria bacterium HGW-Deltaproteobacteria-19]